MGFLNCSNFACGNELSLNDPERTLRVLDG